MYKIRGKSAGSAAACSGSGRGYRQLSLAIESGTRDVGAEHEAIAQAAHARDVPRAPAELARHFENTAEFVRKMLD